MFLVHLVMYIINLHSSLPSYSDDFLVSENDVKLHHYRIIWGAEADDFLTQEGTGSIVINKIGIWKLVDDISVTAKRIWVEESGDFVVAKRIWGEESGDFIVKLIWGEESGGKTTSVCYYV